MELTTRCIARLTSPCPAARVSSNNNYAVQYQFTDVLLLEIILVVLRTRV